MKYCIGIDIGTNSTRAMLVDTQGRQISVASRAYPLDCPAPNYAEQNAEDWYNAVVETVRDVLPENPADVMGISFSTQAGSTVPVDENGMPLRPALSWMDGRATQQIRRISSLRSSDDWHIVTGTHPTPHLSIGHIAWLRDNEPEVFQKARWFLTTPDFINLRLTGNAVMDRTNCLMTGMLNVQTGGWDALSLEANGIDESRLAQLWDGGALVGGLTAQAAQQLGLPEGTKVFNGAHDQYACALGCGAVNDGDSMLSCGTAWVLLGSFRNAIHDKTRVLYTGYHAVENMRGAFYAISAGSQPLNWIRSLVGIDNSKLGEMNRIAATRIEKNRDLFFYPYLVGSVSLDAATPCTATMKGMTLSTDQYDMALAAMEGVVFETTRAAALFADAGLPIRQLRMMGGAANSDLWANILAATTGIPVARPKMNEAALMGASILALVGCGAFADYPTACNAVLGEDVITEPDEKLRLFYAEKFKRYMAGHPITNC